MKHQPTVTVERYIPEMVGYKRRWDSRFAYASKAQAEEVLLEKIAYWRSKGWQPLHSRIKVIKMQVSDPTK